MVTDEARPLHRLIGSHDESLLTGQRIQHVECDCGWHGEVHVWAEHKDTESSR